MLEEKIKRNKLSQAIRTYNSLYDWQHDFNKATATHTACMLMAANQCVTAHTLIEVVQGKEVKTLRFLDTLSEQDVNVRYWAGGSLHDTDNWRAYFQGILPTVRLYLSNGQYLDCTGGHKVLDGEGYYRTILSLLSDEDAPHYYQTTEDYQANYGEGDYRHDQQPHVLLDIDLALLLLLIDVQKHSQQSSLLKDEAAQIDQHTLISLCGDLRSNQGDLYQIEGLIDKFSSLVSLPSSEQLFCLRQVSELLQNGKADLPRLNAVSDLCKIFSGGVVGSNRIYFPQPILLMSNVSILAYQGIGLQPCFDYQIPDHHNYVASGIVNHNCGKSRTGCVMDAYHLTGDYPEDWEGHKFKFPPMCWLLGYSGEKTRDLLQSKLFGRFSGTKWEGGLVSADKILDHRAMTGTSGAMREIRVKHKNGTSICQFWSYSQGQHALMGDVVDWYHIDEEPKDQQIYPQVITRTLNGDQGRGGRGILTFTPENGRTELVCSFMDHPSPSKYLQTATWDDAPHMSEEAKEAILSQYPTYQRDMRSRGIPLMGAGLIFEHDEKAIRCDPFEIPEHWLLINGLDFGWDHPQAHIQMAWDMGADTFYIIHAFKQSKIQPHEAWHVVKPWAEDVPTAWPADGLQTEKGSAKQQKDYYEEAGFEMLSEHATWEEGGVGVEAGLMEMNNLFKTGRLKVFSHLKEVFEELRQYHRVSKANGKSEIVQIKEDLICAIRYAYMMRRHAMQKNDIGRDFEDEDDFNPDDMNAGGY